MLMEAIKPWINWDHEGVVHPGQRFEAHSIRARELELAGLAVPCLDEDEQMKVVADPPPAAPPPEKAKPRNDTKPLRKGRR